MYISAESSFALAGTLLPVGLFCMKQSTQKDRPALLFSTVPFLFGIQQICEGLVWIGIGREEVVITQTAALAYLFFALLFWPVWIPLCALFLEQRKNIRHLFKLIAVLSFIGSSAFYAQIVWKPEDLRVAVVHHSIQYNVAQSAAVEKIPLLAWQLAYCTTVSLPLILVGRQRKGLFTLSVAIIIGAMISHVYFWYAFASVWCFCAAILSVMFAYAFYRMPAQAVNFDFSQA